CRPRPNRRARLARLSPRARLSRDAVRRCGRYTMSVYTDRLARLRTAMSNTGFEALYSTHPANRRYLTGYTGEDHPPEESAGAFLIPHAAAYLRTSGTNAPLARGEAPDYEVVAFSTPAEAVEQLREIVARHGITRLGFEEGAIVYDAYQ